jgi:hypothetical protein
MQHSLFAKVGTNFADIRWSLSIVLSRNKATELLVNEKEMVMLLCLREFGGWVLIGDVNHRHSVGVRILVLILIIYLYSLFLYAKSAAKVVSFRFSTMNHKLK